MATTIRGDQASVLPPKSKSTMAANNPVPNLKVGHGVETNLEPDVGEKEPTVLLQIRKRVEGTRKGDQKRAGQKVARETKRGTRILGRTRPKSREMRMKPKNRSQKHSIIHPQETRVSPKEENQIH